MSKKTMILALVGALGVMFIPDSAGASWKHHDTSIVQNVQLGLTGNVRFQTELGTVECQVTSRAKFLAGQTTGTVETFVPHPTDTTANCRGLGGLAFCQYHNLTPQAPNWTIHTAAYQTTQLQTTGTGEPHLSSVVETIQDIAAETTGGFCPWKQVKITAGTVGWVPRQAATVSTVDLNGTLVVDIEHLGGETTKTHALVSGALQIEAPNQGTYSV
jgi:hypothetical protein